jgi:hypothetical protein
VPSDTAFVRVLVVDEQEVVRHGVTQVLEGDAGIPVVGEAGSVAGRWRGDPRCGRTSPCSACGRPTAAVPRSANGCGPACPGCCVSC